MRRLAKLAPPGPAEPPAGGSSVRAGAAHANPAHAETAHAETGHAATAGLLQPGRSLIRPHDLSTPDAFRRPAGQRPLTGGAEP